MFGCILAEVLAVYLVRVRLARQSKQPASSRTAQQVPNKSAITNAEDITLAFSVLLLSKYEATDLKPH